MPLSHAIARIDHHSAQVLHVDSEHVLERTVKEHVHYTRQHGSKVRSEHEFDRRMGNGRASQQGELVKLAREFFVRRGELVGSPRMT